MCVICIIKNVFLYIELCEECYINKITKSLFFLYYLFTRKRVTPMITHSKDIDYVFYQERYNNKV